MRYQKILTDNLFKMNSFYVRIKIWVYGFQPKKIITDIKFKVNMNILPRSIFWAA